MKLISLPRERFHPPGGLGQTVFRLASLETGTKSIESLDLLDLHARSAFSPTSIRQKAILSIRQWKSLIESDEPPF